MYRRDRDCQKVIYCESADLEAAKRGHRGLGGLPSPRNWWGFASDGRLKVHFVSDGPNLEWQLEVNACSSFYFAVCCVRCTFLHLVGNKLQAAVGKFFWPNTSLDALDEATYDSALYKWPPAGLHWVSCSLPNDPAAVPIDSLAAAVIRIRRRIFSRRKSA